MAFALRFGVPVVELGTWTVERGAHPPVSIVRATSAEEAATRALALVQQS
jgi:hypothetical protein